MKNKKIAIIVLSIILVVSSFIVTMVLLNNQKTDDTKVVSIYGTITEVGNNYIKLNPVDGEEQVMVLTDDLKYKEGDFIFAKVKGDKADKIELIVSSEKANIIIENKTTEVPTTVETTTKSKTTVTSTTVVTTYDASLNEEAVLSYVETENNNLKSNFNKGTAKQYFVSLIDFIFYGGKIKGTTFNELTNSAKEKVIYLALKTDGIIDKNIPGYKETLGNSYKNAKKQLIVKYTEVSTKVCTEKQDLCAEIKRDVADLKNSLNITWDIIYDIYVEMIKPAGAAGLQKLSDWYKVWKND